MKVKLGARECEHILSLKGPTHTNKNVTFHTRPVKFQFKTKNIPTEYCLKLHADSIITKLKIYSLTNVHIGDNENFMPYYRHPVIHKYLSNVLAIPVLFSLAVYFIHHSLDLHFKNIYPIGIHICIAFFWSFIQCLNSMYNKIWLVMWTNEASVWPSLHWNEIKFNYYLNNYLNTIIFHLCIHYKIKTIHLRKKSIFRFFISNKNYNNKQKDLTLLHIHSQTQKKK